MREGWVEAELKSVCTLQRGFDLPKNDRTSGSVPLMSSSGRIDFVADAKVAGPGVVTGRSGSIGRVYFVEKDYWPLNTTLYIRDFHGNYPRFVYYLLSSFDLGRFTSGAGVPTLNRNHVHGELVRIPTSIEEQKRIVAILDEAFAGIDTAVANTEKNLANARELFESYLNSVFSQRGEGGVEKKLGEICVLRNGRAYKKSELLDRGKYPVLRVGNFFTNRNWYYSNLELDETKYCDVGDLLYAWSASFGPRIWEGRKVIFHYHIWRVDFDRQIVTKKFLHHWLYWDAKSIQKDMGAGTTMVHVSMKSMNSRNVYLPPLVEQKRMAEELDALREEVDRLEGLYQQKLTALAELKQSLLQKAFAGELTADAQDEVKAALA